MTPLRTLSSVLIAFGATVAPLHAQADDLKIGHLTYHSGEYGAFGDFFDAVTDFSIGIINETPPLGRTLTVQHQDLGSIGEARAAMHLVNTEKVDVLLNSAHGYLDYRDDLLAQIASGRDLLLPSVHGGAIDAAYGGTGTEPLFRGAPMDTAIGTAAVLHAKDSGKSSVTIVSSDIAGAKLQRDTAVRVAAKLGVDVTDTIEFHPGTADFGDVAGRISAFMPEAVLLFAPPEESARLVKAGADMGQSWFVVGGTELAEPAFAETAGLDALQKHQSVHFTGFAHTDGAAWDFYKAAAEGSAQAERIGDVTNTYAIQYYDLLMASALAIEQAGSTDPEAWAAAMHSVTDGQGEQVHTYAEGIAALRDGKDIDYDGVTGTVEYSDTGVVAGTIGIYQWADADTVESVRATDGEMVMALSED